MCRSLRSRNFASVRESVSLVAPNSAASTRFVRSSLISTSLADQHLLTVRTLQVRDVETPVGSIRNMNVAVWPVGVGDMVDLHV
ncbi:MAG: hypothetical protein Udaeo2_02250 [Candidatus Udaeobacter sp.]|nr:MAG: hypothetical protein Udaeo2_02250 [Candidatus Udaeobacter sp.]